MVPKWLERRWEFLLPELEKRSLQQEAEIRILCEEEIAAWRVHPGYTSANSLRNPITETRNRIRQFAVTEENRWFNPKAQAWEHIALKYLNLSSEEWMQLNRPDETTLQLRQLQRLLLPDPAALIQKGEQLLEADTWPEVLLGITLVTGRSMAEILSTGQFREKTAYSLSFAGPRTIYDQMSEPFEVPTLVHASRVINAVERVRGMIDCTGVQRRQISRWYGQPVREAAYRHFVGLVPVRSLEDDLYTQLWHSVYGCLAVFWYCPPEIPDLLYLATIQNHQKILETASEEERWHLAWASHYYDYRLGDERRGIRLGEPEVEVLEVFQRGYTAAVSGGTAVRPGEREVAQPLEEDRAARRAVHAADDAQAGYLPSSEQQRSCVSSTPEEVILMAQVGEPSLVNGPDHLREQHSLKERETIWSRNVFLSSEEERASEEETRTYTRAVTDFASQEGVRQEAPEQQPQGERLQLEIDVAVLPPEEEVLIRRVLASVAQEELALVLRHALVQEGKQRFCHPQEKTSVRANVHLLKEDVHQLPTARLRCMKSPQAIQERIRRGVLAIMRYNEQHESFSRWCITAPIVQQLVGGSMEPIQRYLRAHRDEIEQHHQTFDLSRNDNDKAIAIGKRMRLAEQPEAFIPCNDVLIQPYEEYTHDAK